MILTPGLHLAYCTNVHPGEDWAQTFNALETRTLEVKRRLAVSGPYGIGLRLSDLASRELSEPAKLLAFQRWLERHQCYVFTINGFPYGQFHGSRVKEAVYLPDWTDSLRLEYTLRLFELLARLLPASMDGSVSTLPGGFKEFVSRTEDQRQIRNNLWRCVEQVARISERANRPLCLGLEPEPCCFLETSEETVAFFDRLRDEHPADPRLDQHLGVTYDTCHLAVEFESPSQAVRQFQQHGIKISKFQLSNALALRTDGSSSPLSGPAPSSELASYVESVYLHQTIIRRQDGSLARFIDLDQALAQQDPSSEWRVHFHVPLHSRPAGRLTTTSSHLLGVLDELRLQPQLCSHLEIETYTWSVLPEPLRTQDVCEQLAAEYDWVIRHLVSHGLVSA